MGSLNSNSYNVKFTMNCSQSCITFLDTMVSTDTRGYLKCNLYCKETAGNTIVQSDSSDSSHTLALLKSNLVRQYLRIRRNSLSDLDFKIQKDELCKRLLARGYSKTSLQKSFLRENNSDRIDLIYKTKTRKSTDPRFITKYNREHSNIRSILKKR